MDKFLISRVEVLLKTFSTEELLLTIKFLSRIEKGEDCWMWTGTKAPTGYGCLTFSKKIRLAHRLSWELYHGQIPGGLFVLHKCDNRICVNPNHLFLGTQRDNMLDMIKKGRSKLENYFPKLSWKDIDYIRQCLSKRTFTQAQLCRKFRVSDSYISKIFKFTRRKSEVKF